MVWDDEIKNKRRENTIRKLIKNWCSQFHFRRFNSFARSLKQKIHFSFVTFYLRLNCLDIIHYDLRQNPKQSRSGNQIISIRLAEDQYWLILIHAGVNRVRFLLQSTPVHCVSYFDWNYPLYDDDCCYSWTNLEVLVRYAIFQFAWERNLRQADPIFSVRALILTSIYPPFGR